MIVPVLPKANLLGVGVTVATPDEMVQELRRAIQERRPAGTVAAVNVHTFTEARRSPRYREALNDAVLGFVDGVPIRWLLRACGASPPPRIHGADLMARLLRELPRSRHLFFGSTPETLDQLAAALKRDFPGTEVAGFISPPFRKSAVPETEEMLARINASNADVLWVALGAPKQEVWALLNRSRIAIPVVACVGAAFEILAGRFSRAPQWMQTLGLEWFWRMAQDPARLWRRYFSTNGFFAACLLGCWFRGLTRPRRDIMGAP